MLIVGYDEEPPTIYPDGLAKPFKRVRKRRFRKRVSKWDIESIEAEVNRLLSEDEKALEIRYGKFRLFKLQFTWRY